MLIVSSKSSIISIDNVIDKLNSLHISYEIHPVKLDTNDKNLKLLCQQYSHIIYLDRTGYWLKENLEWYKFQTLQSLIIALM